MNDFSTLFRHWRVSVGVLIIVVLVVLNFDRINFIRSNPIDRTDYAAVATDFIRSSGFIAQRIGKVTRISHVGKGGGSGKESYNVFRVVGEESSGILNITLTRKDNDEWEVTLAEMTTSGTVFEVPISRSTGDKWRSFKWK